MNLTRFAPLFFILIGLSSQAQQTTPQPSPRADIPRSSTPTPAPIPLQFNTNFKGSWAGTLEYRDYSASSPDAPHIKLPTTLNMRPSPDGRAINLEYTYDDGPDKTRPGTRKIVHEREILAFTADTALLTGTSTAQNQSFLVDGIPAFARIGLGTLVLTGPGKENDKPVDFRLTLTLTPTTFTWLKESRPASTPAPNTAAPHPTDAVQQPVPDDGRMRPRDAGKGAPQDSGAPFVFRDQYTFTRTAAPAAKP